MQIYTLFIFILNKHYDIYHEFKNDEDVKS